MLEAFDRKLGRRVGVKVLQRLLASLASRWLGRLVGFRGGRAMELTDRPESPKPIEPERAREPEPRAALREPAVELGNGGTAEAVGDPNARGVLQSRAPALAATMQAPEASAGGLALPAPSLQGVADAAERDRVFEALFGVPVAHRRLGSYLVLGTLGQGAMGTVLEALDPVLDRRVAVKVLHRELSERHRTRLVREAQALARLSHPNVVQVFEVGEADGQLFISMELVHGRSLADWLERNPRPGWRECVQAYLQAGEGLAAAHAEELVHRDFKPGNAVIDDEGRVRVLDFGLARHAEDVKDDEPGSTGAELRLEQLALVASLTETGTVLGTPAYMPLEQMQGQRVDARSDQFSFCISLYEALYGERPFDGSSMSSLLLALEVGKVRPTPTGITVPAALRNVVLRGLASDPDERWPSMEALLAELRRVVAPRRRRAWVLGMVGGLTALGFGLWQQAEVGFRCEGAWEQLDGVWDQIRKQQVEDAILGTGLSYAPDTWQRVEQRLDEYASGWADKHTEVCEATSVRQEQSAEVMDLRMECLRGRRVALREAVGVLAVADPARVEKAVELVASLPALSRCDDVEALEALLPPPDDPEVAERVELVRERLLHVRALEGALAYDRALVEAEEVVEQAERLGYAPLQSEALLQRGRLRDSTGRPVEAQRDVEQAYLLAAEYGHDGVEAEAAVQLTSTVGASLRRRREAEQWGKIALALARAPQIEPRIEALALHAIGRVVLDEKPGEAFVHFQRVLAIKEGGLAPGEPHVSIVLGNISTSLSYQGKKEEALEYARSALAAAEESLGPGHPIVGNLFGTVSLRLSEQNKLEEALALNQRRLAILQDALGPRHPDTVDAHVGITSVLMQQGKVEEAIIHQRHALAACEGNACVTALRLLGMLLGQRGESEEALVHLRRALAIDEAEFASHTHDVIHHNIGTVLFRQGKFDEAQTHYERALALKEGNLVSQPGVVSSLLLRLAQVTLAKHDPHTARAYAERCVAIWESRRTDPRQLALGRFVLAQALWPDPAQRARARSLAEDASRVHAALGPLVGGEEDIAGVDAWLAEHPWP